MRLETETNYVLCSPDGLPGCEVRNIKFSYIPASFLIYKFRQPFGSAEMSQFFFRKMTISIDRQ
jgi:hypothetical protein